MKPTADPTSIVFDSLRRINATIARKKPVDIALETRLFGRRGSLNSLGLVWLVATVEQKIREEHARDLTLVDDRVTSGDIRPFYSVGTLIDYVAELLAQS